MNDAWCKINLLWKEQIQNSWHLYQLNLVSLCIWNLDWLKKSYVRQCKVKTRVRRIKIRNSARMQTGNVLFASSNLSLQNWMMTQGLRLLFEEKWKLLVLRWERKPPLGVCKSRKMKLHIQLRKSFQNSRQCSFSRDKLKTIGQHKPFSPCAGILPCKGELCHFPRPLQMSQACVKQILLRSEHGKYVHWLWDLGDTPGSPLGHYCFRHLC